MSRCEWVERDFEEDAHGTVSLDIREFLLQRTIQCKFGSGYSNRKQTAFALELGHVRVVLNSDCIGVSVIR